jgi:hypothetical protein
MSGFILENNKNRNLGWIGEIAEFICFEDTLATLEVDAIKGVLAAW